MLVAPTQTQTQLKGSITPSLWAGHIADCCAAFAYGCVIVSLLAGAPKVVKSISLTAALGASIAAWAVNSDPSQVDAQIAGDALRETRLKATNAELVEAQTVAAQHREIETAKQILLSIAEAPMALQPLLLEQAGFGHLVPRLYGAASVSTGPIQTRRGSQGPTKTAEVVDVEPIEPDFIEDIQVVAGVEALLERNLAGEIVALDVPALLLGESGSGKSGLILDAIEAAITKHHAHVQILDAKNSSIYNHLRENYPDRISYYECAGVEGGEAALDILRGLNKVMLSRSDADHSKYRPMLVVLDEANVMLDVTVGTKLDGAEGRDTLSAAIKSEIRTLANQGRTRKFKMLLSSHQYDLRQLGMSGASHEAVALARNGNLRAVDALLKAMAKQQRVGAIKEELQNIRDEVAEVPVALTSIAAAGLYRLPYQPRTTTGVPQLPETPLEDFAENSGLSGELDSSERLDDLADLINLRAWWGKHSPVEDAALLERWNQVAQQPLTEAQVPGLRSICEMEQAAFEVWIAELEREAME